MIGGLLVDIVEDRIAVQLDGAPAPIVTKLEGRRWKAIVASSVVSCERIGGFYRAEGGERERG